MSPAAAAALSRMFRPASAVVALGARRAGAATARSAAFTTSTTATTTHATRHAFARASAATTTTATAAAAMGAMGPMGRMGAMSAMGKMGAAAAAAAAAGRRSFSVSSSAQLARLTLCGHLTASPVLNKLPSGADVLNYTVAVNFGPRDARKTSFFNVSDFAPDERRRHFMLALEKG